MSRNSTPGAGLNSLVLAGIRQHSRSFAGVFVALLAASTLITALGVLVDSGVRGGYAPQRYTAADVIVGGQQSISGQPGDATSLSERVSLPAGALAAIAALPQVAKVIPDLSVQLSWSGKPIDAHGWASAAITPYALRAGHAPTGNSDVVVDAAAAPSAKLGDKITLAHGGTPAEYTVVGIAGTKAVTVGGSTAHTTRNVFLSDARADALSNHPGSPPILAVTARSGVSADALAADIRAQVPAVDTYTGRARGDAEFLDSGSARSILVTLASSLAGTLIIIALFIIASTLSLSVQSRKRDFALLRAVGSTPRQIYSLIGRETILVAFSAAIIGIGPGYLLANVLQWAFSSAGVIPGDFALVAGPLPAIAAVSLSVLTAWGAALVAARHAARINPIEALREASTTPSQLGKGRVVTGVAMVGIGIVGSVLPLFVHGPAAMAGPAGAALAFIVALGLLGPRLAGTFVNGFGRILRRSSSPAAFLAQANTRGNTRRLAAAIVPLALGITLGLVQLGTQSIVSAEANVQSRAGVTAGLLVTGKGSALSEERVQAISQTAGVRSVNPVAISQASLSYKVAGDTESEQFGLQGIDPQALATTLDLGVVAGSLDKLQGPDTVALSTDAAALVGAKVGGVVHGLLGDGTPVTATVVATYTRGLGFGDLTMANDVVRSHTTNGFNDYVLVSSDASAQVGVKEALAHAGFQVADRTELRAAGEDSRNTQSVANLIALIVILGYIAIAVVNTLMMATMERRREFALLRLIGSGRRQVRAMMRTESFIVAITAGVLGVVAAVPPLIGLSLGVTGQPVPNVSLVAFALVIGSMCALGLAALAVATQQAMRTRPIDEIGSRE